MKLSLQQLNLSIAKNLAPIYIVSGDEPLLTQEAVDLLNDAGTKQGFSERIRLSGDDWGDTLMSEAQSLSLFATQRIIQIDLTTAKFNATTSKPLQEYAVKPSKDVLLILRTAKIDAKTEQSNWYKALSKNCIMVAIWPIPSEALPNWILQRAKKLNLKISSQAAEQLATLVEGNLLAASQELEKLCLLNIDQVDLSVIEDKVVDHARFDIFMLVDSALLGDSKRAIRIIDNLCAEDVEPTLILWALVREIRTMATIGRLSKQGTPRNTLYAKHRIWDKRQPAANAFLQRHQPPALWTLIKEAAQIDRMIKGVEAGNLWEALKILVMNMCGHDVSGFLRF